eukprot:10667116-Alexandrium_andersonii.AAC.1
MHMSGRLKRTACCQVETNMRTRAPEDWRRPATTNEISASSARRCRSEPRRPSSPRISAPITVAS